MKKISLPSFSISRRDVIAAGASGLAGSIAAASPLYAAPPKIEVKKMDIDRFVDDCVNANKEADSQAAVREVLERAVSEPGAVLRALGKPTRAGINVLHRSKTLTIFNAVWTPQMNLMPHDHLMWASIGIYTGREDNIFWRSTEDGIEAFGAAALFENDVADLPADAIHSVTNPLLRFAGGIHIYGGDFFATERDQWDPETLDRELSDGESIREMFERENARLNL